MKFENYKVMITGATSGIGLACTKMFLNEGAKVIGIGRNFKLTEELGENFIPFKCDVTDAEQIRAACDFMAQEFDGKLDVFINVAGLGVKNSVKEMPVDRFQLGVDLLLRAPILFTSYLHESLLKGESGNPSIIHVSSAASRSIVPDNILYGLFKTALVLYTKQSASGLPGIRVNSVSPGTIDTPIFNRDKNAQRSPEQIQQMYDVLSKSIPSGRIGEPDECADLVSFLASTEASYITGADFLIDGGIMTKFS